MSHAGADDHNGGGELYETETMAELCARQGRLGEAVAIYKHLALLAATPEQRARIHARLALLEARWQPEPAPHGPPPEVEIPVAPGVAVMVGDDQVAVAWALPAGTPAPALELLFIARGPAGVDTTKQTIPVDSHSGRRLLAAPGVHTALAAAGTIREARFVPLASALLARSKRSI